MSRLVTVRSLYLSLTLAGVVAAQDPPPLEPPTLEPPRAIGTAASPSPPASKPDAAKSATPPARSEARTPDTRPMLAIPGVTAPASRPSVGYRPPVAGPGQPAGAPPPPLLDALPLPSDRSAASSPGGIPLTVEPDSPSRDVVTLPPDTSAPRRSSRGAGMPRAGASRATPPGETIPLTIDPLDDDPAKRPDGSGRATPPRTSNGRTTAGADSTRELPPPDDEPIRPRLAPRRGGVLSRLFGPPPEPVPPPRPSPRADDSRARRGPDAESDADVAARRRIERQIRATLGDRLRSFDVQITGRNVVVTAQPSRFWLRRSVRRSLETLPALQGYRARIEVSD
jgi:hypothetical protein